jgi:hypothetical protein
MLKIIKLERRKKMKKTSLTALVIFLVIFLVACAAKDQKKVEQGMKQPINCATAQGDIRMLEHEKAHVAQEVVEGVTAIFPAGLVVGIVSGTEKEKLKVGTGEYNKMIDKRIAEIKEKCGVE